MKVIHLISGGDVGGAKTHVHTLLAGLTKTEQVRLCCFVQGPFSQEAAALGIPTTVLSGGIRSSLKSLQTMIREEGFEIVHCHGSKANLIGSLLKSRLHLLQATRKFRLLLPERLSKLRLNLVRPLRKARPS